MQIHVLQTGTAAIKQAQRQRRESGHPILNMFLDRNWTGPLPIFAFLIEHPEGLIIVDTGETAHATEPGYFPRWHPYYRFALREWVLPGEEIGPQMRTLGFEPKDVRWVLLTHLHTDHAGGLAYFPRAEHMLSRREYENARGALGLLRGFLPNHWPEWFSPTLIDMQSKTLGLFSGSYPVTRAGDVRLVPTPGHTPGHLSVVVNTPEVTYFLAGDASYTQGLMLLGQTDGISANQTAARQTLAQIYAICRTTPTIYLPAHDPETPERLANRELAINVPLRTKWIAEDSLVRDMRS